MSQKVVPIRTSTGGLGEEVSEHESFGMVGLSRFTTTGVYMFGSSIQHASGITLRIARASQLRSLHHERYHATSSPLIEVQLTSAQFAEMVTSMNIGEGVPCTIHSVNGEHMPAFPVPRSLRQVASLEVDEHLKDMQARSKKAFDLLNMMLTGESSLTKANLKTVMSEVSAVTACVGSNGNFIAKSMIERIDKQMSEAKANFEGFMAASLAAKGMLAVQDGLNPGPRFMLEEGKSQE